MFSVFKIKNDECLLAAVKQIKKYTENLFK